MARTIDYTDLLDEVRDRFRRCHEWEKDFRRHFIDDMKFFVGDSVNNYQWSETAKRARRSKPIITVNKARQHALQIINDNRQNAMSMVVRPISEGASYDGAEIVKGILRSIENDSQAQNAYNNAYFGSVGGGLGMLRLRTDWADEESFNQKIIIDRVENPLSVLIDPDIKHADGSDADFAFVFEDIPIDMFKKRYPKQYKKKFLNRQPLDSVYNEEHDVGKTSSDTVRICEYFRRIEQKIGTLLLFSDGTMMSQDEFDIQNALREAALELAGMPFEARTDIIQKRDMKKKVVEHYVIAGGDEVVERKDWPGSYIPLIRVLGEETVINKQMDRRGHIRYLRGAQEIYNYYLSTSVEQVSHQPKTPWIVAKAAVEGTEFDGISSGAKEYYTYNHTDDNNQPIPPPQRVEPPQLSPAYMQLMQTALADLMYASGQYEANMGAKSNEISGKAIQQRQRQGDNATYHFIARLGDALRNLAKQALELIPIVYNQKQIIKILGDDGTERSIQVDPNHPEASTMQNNPDAPTYTPDQISHIFNPTFGKYEVVADVGPSWLNRSQEEFAALGQLLQANPEIFPMIADKFLLSADIPDGPELAQRFKNMMPPQATGQGPNPQTQQLQQQMAQQHQNLQEMGQKLQEAQMNAVQEKMARQKSEMDYQVKLYDSETKRMAAVGQIDPMALKPIIREMVSSILGMPANPIIAAHQQHDEGLPGSDTQLQQADQQHQQDMAAQGHDQSMQMQEAQEGGEE